MWDMHNRTTQALAEKNRGRSDHGKNFEVEDTASLDDAGNVNLGMAGSGVVHGATGSN